MSALSEQLHLIAVRAHATVCDGLELAVIGNKLRDAPLIILEKLSGALQVAKPLLAGVTHKQHALGGLDTLLRQIFCHMQKNGNAGGIVADTGTAQRFTVIGVGHRFSVGKHRIGMRDKNGDLVTALAIEGDHNVERLVDIGTFNACIFQPLHAILCSLVLEMRGRGDRAKLTQGVDHGFFMFLYKLFHSYLLSKKAHGALFTVLFYHTARIM